MSTEPEQKQKSRKPKLKSDLIKAKLKSDLIKECVYASADSAKITAHCAKTIASGYPGAEDYCDFCAEACEHYANACKNIEDEQASHFVEACRLCAHECRNMAHIIRNAKLR